MRQGRFRISLSLVFAAIMLFDAAPGIAGPPSKWMRNGRTTRANARQESPQAGPTIPWQQLTPEASRRIRDIIGSPTMSQTLQPQIISSDPDLFLFLVRHPEVIVGIWDVMGITKVQTQRTGPYSLQGSDGAGTTCKIDLVYGTPNLHIFIATGEYRGPMLTSPITGRCAIVLESGYTDGAADESLVTGKMHVYMQLDGLGIDLIARTLQGLIWQTTEQNFAETGKFLAQIHAVSERNPMGMRDLAERLPNVEEPIRDELARIAFAVAATAVGQPMTPVNDTPEELASLTDLANPVRPQKNGPRLRR